MLAEKVLSTEPKANQCAWQRGRTAQGRKQGKPSRGSPRPSQQSCKSLPPALSSSTACGSGQWRITGVRVDVSPPREKVNSIGGGPIMLLSSGQVLVAARPSRCRPMAGTRPRLSDAALPQHLAAVMVSASTRRSFAAWGTRYVNLSPVFCLAEPFSADCGAGFRHRAFRGATYST